VAEIATVTMIEFLELGSDVGGSGVKPIEWDQVGDQYGRLAGKSRKSRWETDRSNTTIILAKRLA